MGDAMNESLGYKSRMTLFDQSKTSDIEWSGNQITALPKIKAKQGLNISPSNLKLQIRDKYAVKRA